VAPSDTALLPVVAENRFPESGDTISLTFKETLQGLTDGEAEETGITEEKSRYSRPKFMTGLSGIMAMSKMLLPQPLASRLASIWNKRSRKEFLSGREWP